MTFLRNFSNVIAAGNYQRHDERCTPDTIYQSMMNAWMSCTYGNEEPVVVRMGKGFSESLLHRKDAEPITFRTALVLVDDRMDNWLAQMFIWDRYSYVDPILFVGATVTIVDGI